MFKGYFDDSTADKEGVLVLGGYIARVDGWLAYTKACDDLLTRIPLEEFKMKELAKSNEGMERASWLYRQAIEQNVLARVAVISPIKVIKDAVNSFHWPSNIENKEFFSDPYYLTWKGIVSVINQERIESGHKDPFELVFDNQNHQEDELLRAWLDFKKTATPEEINAVGGIPNFGDSKKILPLQAADQYAWWVRKWFLESENEKDFSIKVTKQPFPWDAKKFIPHETMLVSKTLVHNVLNAMFPDHRMTKMGGNSTILAASQSSSRSS